MQAVKQQYPGYDVADPIPFRFKPPEDGHSDPQNSIYIRFERYPTGEWVLAKKNAGQVCMHFSCCVLLTLVLFSLARHLVNRTSTVRSQLG